MTYSAETDKIYGKMIRQARITLQGVIMPACTIIILFYFIANYHSNIFYSINALPGVIILSIGVILVAKLLFHTKLDDSEIRKFWGLLLGISFFLAGESLYFYQQAYLRIDIPYPSIADGPYLLSILFISYFILASLFSLKNKKGVSSASMILGLFAGSLPLVLALYSIYSIDFSEPTSRYVSFVDVLYYVFDGLMLCPALIILINLKKNEAFVVHWLLITIAIIVLVFADVGYTYLSLINESYFMKTEWIWSIFYAIGYVLLVLGIYWFDRIKNVLEANKINAFLEKDEKDRLNKSSINNKDISADSGEDYIERTIGYEDFFRKINTLLKRSIQIKILFYDKYWLTNNKINALLSEILQMANVTQMKVNILIPLNHMSSKSLLSHAEHKNILISIFDRRFSSDALVFIFEEDQVAILDRLSTDDTMNEDYLFYGLFSNKETFVWSHVVTFEKIWLLEKAVNM